MATFNMFRGFKEDREVQTLIDIATWKKYLERRAEFEQKYYENAVEWITSIQKEIKKLPPNTTNSVFYGDHWGTALECDVAATKIRADASRNVAKYDREAIAYLNRFTEDKETVKSRKQLQQSLMKSNKSYAKIVSQLDAKQMLSFQYKTKVKEAIKDKILCVISTWRKMFENHTKHLYHKRGLHYNGLLAIKEMNIEQFVEELASSWKFVITVPTASASRSINKEDTDESAIDFNVELSV